MGCTISRPGVSCNTPAVRHNNNEACSKPRHPVFIISAEEKLLIKRQWGILSADMKATGTAVFMKIFKEQPEIKQYFSYRDVDDNSLPSSAELRCHAFRFMQAVGAAIENIDDLEKSMTEALLTLGKQHVKFTGFKPEYIQTFYNAILKIWQEKLGDHYTPVCTDAWCHLLRFIMDQLEKGYYMELNEGNMSDNSGPLC